MRDDYDSFRAAGGEILVVTRHEADEMRAYWKKERLPFRGVADPDGRITERYGQQWKLFSLGRMPAQVVIDCQGKIAFSHYGKGMSDIVPNKDIVETLKAARQSSNCPD